jgi:hypothetical protein
MLGHIKAEAAGLAGGDNESTNSSTPVSGKKSTKKTTACEYRFGFHYIS